MRAVTRGKSVDTEVFDCIARRRRRVILALLRANPSGLDVETLATRVVARTDGKAPAAVTDAERQDASIALYHQSLPRLEAAGLLDRDTDEGHVELADHSALDDPAIRRAIDTDDESLDRVFELLANERRKRTLAVLDGLDDSVAVRELATIVAASETGRSREAVPEQTLDSVAVSLTHVHLPKLRDAGLVERDGDSGQISGVDHPAIRSEWLETITQ